MYSENHPPTRAEDVAHREAISDIKSSAIRTVSEAAKVHGPETVLFSIIWGGAFHAAANGQSIWGCGAAAIVGTILIMGWYWLKATRLKTKP
jgi:hypothetical protein